MWRQCILFPDPKSGWQWAHDTVLGLPHLLRVLVTLHRAGIRDVLLPPGSEALQPWLETMRQRRPDLPKLIWMAPQSSPRDKADSPVLGLQGGLLFTPSLLHWFRDATGDQGVGQAALASHDTALVSWIPDSGTAALPAAIHDIPPQQPTRPIPQDMFCQSVHAVAQPGGDRLLLATVGKATDRWHVRWVRGWTFPAMRLLAASPITPNQVSCLGFLVALLGCGLIAQGTYWVGIAGALLLYASWVLDCVDGTLARLTYAESAFGQKLDTILGHLSNLAIFGALVWAVYGGEAWWKTAGAAFFLLGGIVIAQRVSEQEKRLRPRHGPTSTGKLQRFLDKINHRDYAVVILFLMVVRGLPIFLWLSLVGVQVYWLTVWILMQKHRRAA